MTVTLCHADALDLLRATPSNSVDAIVTDPPYGLSDMRPAAIVTALTAWANGDRDRVPDGRGFMGRTWDAFVPPPAVWDEALRVLRPGGYLASFAGSRTYDLMGLSIRLAGFEIRDGLQWLYGTGMPKGLDVGRVAGDAWTGWNTALKPAHEPIVLARKPLTGAVAANVIEHGTGAMNVDACRVGMSVADREAARVPMGEWTSSGTTGATAQRRAATFEPQPGGRHPANVLLDEYAAEWLDEQSGYSKSPTSTGRGAGGQHGITSPRKAQGEVWAPGDEGGASRFFPTFRYTSKASRGERHKAWGPAGTCACDSRPIDPETGSLPLHWRPGTVCAACERPAEHRGHPTVKPVALIEWLVRLLTREGGTVLDPFAGSGSTGEAANRVGCDAILFENDDHSVSLIEQRLGVTPVDLYPVEVDYEREGAA